MSGRRAGGRKVMDDFEAAVEVLHHGRAAVHPVAAVDVVDAIDPLDDGAMDVAADHAIHSPVAGRVGDRLLEVENEADRVLHLVLRIPRQRPVSGNAETPANPRKPRVDPDQEVVRHVAQDGDPAVVARDLVEFVPVQ